MKKKQEIQPRLILTYTDHRQTTIRKSFPNKVAGNLGELRELAHKAFQGEADDCDCIGEIFVNSLTKEYIDGDKMLDDFNISTGVREITEVFIQPSTSVRRFFDQRKYFYHKSGLAEGLDYYDVTFHFRYDTF